MWQVKATLKKRVDVLALKEVGKIILDEIRKESIKVPKLEMGKFDEPCLFEADLFDAHIGKLSWGAESGKNYDLKIARSTYINAVKKLSPYLRQSCRKDFNIRIGFKRPRQTFT